MQNQQLPPHLNPVGGKFFILKQKIKKGVLK